MGAPQLSHHLKRLLGCAGIVAALAALSPTIGTGVASAATGRSSDPGHTAPHVMVIMMENTDFSQTAGSPATPYLNDLIHQYAGFTQAYGWHYPSLPNYLELLAGTTLGISSDCDPGISASCTNLSHERFTDELAAQGTSWHAYFQGDGSGCDDKPADFFVHNYDVEHNPFAYFADFGTQCSHLSNFDPLLSNLSARHAADFNFVVPDLVNDGGDNGTMASGDTWLADNLPLIMSTPWYRQGGQIVVMYDTGYGDSGGVNGSSGGRIPPIAVISARTAGMGLRAAPLNTAGVLRSLEHAYGVPYIGDAADPNNGSLQGALVAGRPTGASPRANLVGDVVQRAAGGRLSSRTSHDALAFDGLHRFADGTTIQVGEGRGGEGVVQTRGLRPIAVPGTTNLESVSCTSDQTCWAVGLGASGSDEAVIVKLVNGYPVSVKPDPAFYGLYGIDCPSAGSCVAVGYDTANIADAVTTITGGAPSAPAEVAGGGEWLNAVSCPTATECYATGLVNYTASIVPIADGTPQTPITVPNAWYLNAIDCTSVGDCVVAGESGNAGEGFVDTLVNGAAGPGQLVPGTEYLYGVGCAIDGNCVLTGASRVGTSGYSHGVILTDIAGQLGTVTSAPASNGLGQAQCGVSIDDCTTVGATSASSG